MLGKKIKEYLGTWFRKLKEKAKGEATLFFLLLFPATWETFPSVSSILKLIWDSIFEPIVNAITSGISLLLHDIFGGFGSSIQTMFQNWSYSLQGLGIWAPVIFVIVIGLAGAVMYFWFDAYGIERDVLGAEEDV
ncbi:hypothetical protein DMB44_05395 [Thermoplasma sp. Kam2015]|uniref:hypothetical protein n=1 Tax=Thermoplasma sp. Kam2015 TaxID=2094122 RepID=UPI000D8ABD07|nr:hypothetical protein [Thermoplasma sp. Kam2015]PYB68156.1 hypothetical protein DMB44_05395 [Thermoplasma sp. Kam2015]